MSAAAAHAVIASFLAAADIPHRRLDERTWGSQMRGDHKLTIPVAIRVTDERVEFESFFMRRPHEDHARFYELLLRRNMRASGIAFALDADGDVYLRGSVPAAALDEAGLDRLLGAILVEADGMFDPAIKIGFARYLAADLRWREKMARAGGA